MSPAYYLVDVKSYGLCFSFSLSYISIKQRILFQINTIRYVMTIRGITMINRNISSLQKIIIFIQTSNKVIVIYILHY